MGGRFSSAFVWSFDRGEMVSTSDNLSIVLLMAVVSGQPPVQAQQASNLFVSTIQPAFTKHCAGCHGEGQTLAKLDLRTREGMLKGGERGPSIVPGKATESLLYQALAGIASLQMPPGGPEKRLPSDVVAAVRSWINAGAPWGDTPTASEWKYMEEDLWAFRPLRNRDRTKNIDDFIAAKLRERGLRPAPRADRRTLIRRATIDLTGLPPTPEEVDAFVNDRSSNAWPKLIERLLASPRHGERYPLPSNAGIFIYPDNPHRNASVWRDKTSCPTPVHWAPVQMGKRAVAAGAKAGSSGTSRSL